MMERLRIAIFLAGMLLAIRAIGVEAQIPGPQPNIVLIMADDMAWHDCGAYGSKEVLTPNIDRLASEGVCFDRMFTSTAMCAPTRQQLFTGLWPMRNGAYKNHSEVKAGVRSIAHHLKELGYRVGLGGKTHFGPPESFPFEEVRMDKNTPALGDVPEFIRGKQPFCLIYASSNPHTPYKVRDERYRPEALTVPAHLFDAPLVREDLARYCAEISMLDQQVGAVMAALEEAGCAEDTLLIFTSEQGSAFPFGGKWTCYESGLKTAFIVRWPGVVALGTRNQALTQYVDVVPTLIAAAGGDPTNSDTGIVGAPDGGSGFDGFSFLNVLLGNASSHREQVFGVHTTSGVMHGSKYYPIRSVRDGRYKLIWNPNHEADFQCVASGLLKRWVASMTPEQREAQAERIAFWSQRPEWEFYDLENDPHELHNLAGEPQYTERMASLRATLKSWMTQQNDLVLRKQRRDTAGLSLRASGPLQED